MRRFRLPDCRRMRTAFDLLWNQVLLQLPGSHLTLDAGRGHVQAGRPEDGVQDELAEIGVAPVLVEVAAGEAEPATAVGTLHDPGQHFIAALGLEDVLVRAAGCGRDALPRVVVGPGHDDRRDAFHFRTEADVEVPLVADREGLDTGGGRVAGQRLDVCLPVRVGRVAGLVIAPQPVEELVARLSLGNLDGIVQARQADTLVHELLELGQVIALDHRMAAAAIHEEDQGLGAVEDRFVLRPAAGDHHGLDAGHLGQALAEQLAAGVELMFAGLVTGMAGDQDDLRRAGGVGRDGVGCSCQADGDEAGEQVLDHERTPLSSVDLQKRQTMKAVVKRHPRPYRAGSNQRVVLPLTTFDFRPLRFSCSLRGRTIRKPTKVASVCHQMLWGRWGSWTLHSGFDAFRAALRSRSASSSHEPPRATEGYSLASGRTTGPTTGLSAANGL